MHVIRLPSVVTVVREGQLPRKAVGWSREWGRKSILPEGTAGAQTLKN